MEGGTENPGEKKDGVIEDISNNPCSLIPVIGINRAVWKAGVPVPDALDITREWLAGLDQSEDGIAVDPQVLDGLEQKALAMRRELKGEICLFPVVVVPFFSFLVCVRFPQTAFGLQRLIFTCPGFRNRRGDKRSGVPHQRSIQESAQTWLSYPLRIHPSW